MLIKLSLLATFLVAVVKSAITGGEEEAFVIGLFDEKPYFDEVKIQSIMFVQNLYFCVLHSEFH